MRVVSSPNHDARAPGAQILYVVLHYTAMKTAQEALDRLCDPAFQVSAHYLIDRDGQIIQLVDEARRAWHAGVSFWRGQDDINSRSIGIELVNDGAEPFADPQIKSLKKLLKEIAARHCLKIPFLLAHSDIAPTRKIDPGPLFPWRTLAEAGLDLWPQTTCSPQDAGDPVPLLSAIGYDCTDPAAALRAFQLRYRPSCADGVADGETLGLLVSMTELINESIRMCR